MTQAHTTDRRVVLMQRGHQHTGPEERVNNRVPVCFSVAGAPPTVVGTQHTVCPFPRLTRVRQDAASTGASGLSREWCDGD